jgi:hypothetical protein
VHKIYLKFIAAITLSFLIMLSSAALLVNASDTIKYGCGINAEEQIAESRALAKAIAKSNDPKMAAKGDLHGNIICLLPMQIFLSSVIHTSWDGK